MTHRTAGPIVLLALAIVGCTPLNRDEGAMMQPGQAAGQEMIAPGMERTAAAAVAYLRQREAIVSGDTVVRYAQPATPRTIRALQLNIGNWDPACERPMSLVILEGDFDGRNLFVSPGTADAKRPGRFVGLVFDRASGDPGDIAVTILSVDGGAFRTALNDLSLPASDMVAPEPVPPYVPCGDVHAPGQPEPNASPTP